MAKRRGDKITASAPGTNKPTISGPDASGEKSQSGSIGAFLWAHKLFTFSITVLSGVLIAVLADVVNDYRKASPPLPPEPDLRLHGSFWDYQKVMLEGVDPNGPAIEWQPIITVTNPRTSSVAFDGVIVNLQGSGYDLGRKLILRPSGDYSNHVAVFESEFALKQAMKTTNGAVLDSSVSKWVTSYPIAIPAMATRIIVPDFFLEIVDVDGKRISLPKSHELGRLIYRLIFGEDAFDPDGKFRCRFVDAPIIVALAGGGEIERVTSIFASAPGCYFLAPR